MSLILVEKDGKNRVAKEVTSDQRAAIMLKSKIWDIDAAGNVTAGPFGPTSPDPVPVPAAGITNDGTGASTQAAIALPGTFSTDATTRDAAVTAAVAADGRPDGTLYLVDDGA